MSYNYHDRGERDLGIAKMLISPQGNPDNDEIMIDNAAYHAQQAIEKELKHILHDLLGVDARPREFRTHQLHDLIDWVESLGYRIPDAIKEISHDTTEWAVGARYNADIVASRADVQDAIDHYPILVETAKNIEMENKSTGIRGRHRKIKRGRQHI